MQRPRHQLPRPACPRPQETLNDTIGDGFLLKNAYLYAASIVFNMEKKHKLLYKSPAMEVVDLKTQGILCASGKYNGFGEEQKW